MLSKGINISAAIQIKTVVDLAQIPTTERFLANTNQATSPLIYQANWANKICIDPVHGCKNLTSHEVHVALCFFPPKPQPD